MIRPGEGVPQTRNQAYSLLAAVHFDISELSPEQVRAIRDLYGLSDYAAIAEGLEVLPE